MNVNLSILSDIVFHMKYAKYLPEKKRRETWEECVKRNMDMHIKKYPQLEDEIKDVYENYVLTKKVLPSMRSMQFAGKPIEINPSRIYNCAYLPIDDYRGFSEVMFLLLGGCFEPNTMVKTITGDKKICDVTTEDQVLTFDIDSNSFSWVKPQFAGETPTKNSEKIELVFDTGKIIQCTSDHKFYTTNRGWVEAKDLNEDDDIKCYDECTDTIE